MAITKEQEKKYIKEFGAVCPVCGSDQIEGGSIDIDNGMAYQNCYCNDCQEEWTDEYSLTGITEAE